MIFKLETQKLAVQSSEALEFFKPLSLPGRKLFGTDGIRGKVGPELNSALAFHVGFWTGQVLQAQTSQRGPVVLGKDSRNSGDMLSSALAAGLAEAGVDVFQVGLCPTPAVAYLTQAVDAIGGIMVSASHNPPGDNGIKLFGPNGMKLAADLQNQIEGCIRNRQDELFGGSPTPKRGKTFERSELINPYLTSILAPLAGGDLRGQRIVLDLAWGAAVHTAPAAFKAMGAEVICLHGQPHGDRINVNCGSTHLEPLAQAVQLYQADLGFAFDGDADRVMAVDAQGHPVDGDCILYLWGRHLWETRQLPGNALVSTVMANLGFERAWEKLGGSLIRTSVGDQHVHAEMIARDIALGGEQSGHILCRHFGHSGDGVLTALHLARLVQQSGQSLADLRQQGFRPYPQLLRNIRVEDGSQRLNWQACDALQETIDSAMAAMGNQGRVLVRASGTEPILRVMVEAECAQLVDYWVEQISQSVRLHLVERPRTLFSA